MITTGKKASPKALKYVSKISGDMLPKSTHWDKVFDILFDGFYCEIHTGKITSVKIFKETEPKSELVTVKEYPAEDTFENGGWNWNYLFKDLSEWMMENRKELLKKKRSKKK